MTTVDARGLSCPQPVLMAKKALEKDGAPLKVLVDDRTPLQNVMRFASNTGHQVSFVEKAGEFEISIK